MVRLLFKISDEFGIGLAIMLSIWWIYLGVLIEGTLLFGPSLIRSIVNNTVFYNVAACYGAFKIIQKMPWLILVEMFVRLHARMVITLPLIFILSSISFILDLFNSLCLMFSYDEIDMREGSFKFSLHRVED